MILTGALVNAAAVFIGALIGLIFKKWISEKLSSFLMQGLAVCVIYVGISGSLSGENAIIAILSMSVGGLIGHIIDFDTKLNKLGAFVERKLTKKDSPESGIALGFVNATMLICVGSMAIVGSLESGISCNHQILFSKSMIDFVAVMMLAATMGWGVVISTVPLLFYQSLLTLFAGFIAPILSESMVNEMSCVGSLVIVMIGLNMLKVTKIKVSNFLLVPFLPILFCFLWDLIF